MLGNINLSLARRTMMRQLGWAADYDGATENLQITNPKNIYSGEYSLKADFSGDVVGQAPAGLTTQSGEFKVKNVNPSPFGSSPNYNECTSAGVAYIPCNQVYGRWKFDFFKAAGSTFDAYIMSNNVGVFTDGIPKYLFRFNSSRAFRFVRADANTIVGSPNDYISDATWYQAEVERRTNGQFYIYLTGGAFTTKTLIATTTGTNPITDNTYVSSNFFVLDLDQGDRIANISCEYGTGSFDLSGFERILHSGNRDFEVPVALGPDLLAGWDFTSGWSSINGSSVIIDNNSFSTSGIYNDGVVKTNCLVVGKVYSLKIAGNTTSTGFSVNTEQGGARQELLTSPNGTIIFTAKYPNLYVRHAQGSGGQSDLPTFIVQEYLSDWQGRGNHSCYITGEDKKSGSFCLKMISTGAGDVNNCITLPADKLLGAKPTDKFTIEGFARGTGILGSELVNGGDFEDGSSLPAYGGAVSSNSTDYAYNGAKSNKTITAAANASGATTPAKAVTQGEQVKVTMWLYLPSAATISVANSGGAVPMPNKSFNTVGQWMKYEEVGVATANGNIYMQITASTNNVTFYVDAVSIKKITMPSVTFATGSKNKTISNLTCIPNMSTNATKAVFNFEATVAELNQGIKIWANQADTIYFDEITYKQRFDVAVSSWIKATRLPDGSQYGVFGNVTVRGGLSLYFRNTNLADIGFSINQNGMGGGQIINSTYTEYGKWALVTLVYSYPNIQLYVNGVLFGNVPYDNILLNQVSGIDKSLYIGYITDVSSPRYFAGQMGEFQWSRFNNINLSDFDGTKYFKSQIPRKYSGGGALVTLHMKFKGPDDATFLKDYSPLQQLVTGVNVTRADQVRGSYPYFSR